MNMEIFSGHYKASQASPTPRDNDSSITFIAADIEKEKLLSFCDFLGDESEAYSIFVESIPDLSSSSKHRKIRSNQRTLNWQGSCQSFVGTTIGNDSDQQSSTTSRFSFLTLRENPVPGKLLPELRDHCDGHADHALAPTSVSLLYGILEQDSYQTDESSDASKQGSRSAIDDLLERKLDGCSDIEFGRNTELRRTISLRLQNTLPSNTSRNQTDELGEYLNDGTRKRQISRTLSCPWLLPSSLTCPCENTRDKVYRCHSYGKVDSRIDFCPSDLHGDNDQSNTKQQTSVKQEIEQNPSSKLIRTSSTRGTTILDYSFSHIISKKEKHQPEWTKDFQKDLCVEPITLIKTLTEYRPSCVVHMDDGGSVSSVSCTTAIEDFTEIADGDDFRLSPIKSPLKKSMATLYKKDENSCRRMLCCPPLAKNKKPLSPTVDSAPKLPSRSTSPIRSRNYFAPKLPSRSESPLSFASSIEFC